MAGPVQAHPKLTPELAMAALRASVEFSSEAIALIDVKSPAYAALIRHTGILPKMRERIATMQAFLKALEGE